MNTPFDTRTPGDARLAIMESLDIARELDHDQAGPEHVLLALLAHVRGTTHRVFAEHDVTYERAYGAIRAFGYPEQETDRSEASADQALAEDRAALRAIGIDLDRVRDAVRANFGSDITEGWGERPDRRERGPRRGRGSEGRGPEGRGGHRGRGHGRGRRGPHGLRDQLTPALALVMHDLRREAMGDAEPGPGFGPGPDRRRFARGLSSERLLQALIASGDPAVETILNLSDDPADLRATVESLPVD